MHRTRPGSRIGPHSREGRSRTGWGWGEGSTGWGGRTPGGEEQDGTPAEQVNLGIRNIEEEQSRKKQPVFG